MKYFRDGWRWKCAYTIGLSDGRMWVGGMKDELDMRADRPYAYAQPRLGTTKMRKGNVRIKLQ